MPQDKKNMGALALLALADTFKSVGGGEPSFLQGELNRIKTQEDKKSEFDNAVNLFRTKQQIEDQGLFQREYSKRLASNQADQATSPFGNGSDFKIDKDGTITDPNGNRFTISELDPKTGKPSKIERLPSEEELIQARIQDFTGEELRTFNGARLLNDQILPDIKNMVMDENFDFDNLQTQFGTSQSVPFLLLPDGPVKDFRRAIDQAKSVIPFTRGGKALTKTEAARVDRLLSPIGKTREQFMKDLNLFSDEFGGLVSLMLFGKLPEGSNSFLDGISDGDTDGIDMDLDKNINSLLDELEGNG